MAPKDPTTKDEKYDKFDTIDVDKIFLSLGKWGKWQTRQLAVQMLTIWSCGFHMLSIVFIGYLPDFECEDIAVNHTVIQNVSTITEYGKCSIQTIHNESGQVTLTETGCVNGWKYFEGGEQFERSRSFVTEWDLICSRNSLAEVSQTLVMAGQGFGAVIFTSLSDKFGRKPTHVFSHIGLTIVAIITAFVPNYTAFAVMRFLTGALQQGTGLCVAILNLELFPQQCRSHLEVIGQLMWSTGIALITPLSFAFRNYSWRYLQICLACMSAWSIIEWWMINESMRWLIANGRLNEAKALIKRACEVNKKDFDTVLAAGGFKSTPLKDLKKDVHEKLIPNSDDQTKDQFSVNGVSVETDLVSQNRTKQYTVCDLLRSKRLLMTSCIMWIAWITNSLTYYGIMLISSSMAGDRFLNFFLGSIVEYPAALGQLLMLNRIGRKKTAITFHTICGVALITATVLTTTSNGVRAMVLSSTIFTLVGKFAITGSFSTIFLYTPELYPTNMRNAGIGMSSMAGRIGAMLAPFTRNLIAVIRWAPGLIFGILCAIVSVFLLFVPETNKRELPQTLEECEIWYKENRFRLPGTKDKNRR